MMNVDTPSTVAVNHQEAELVNDLIRMNLDGQGGFTTAAEDLKNKDYAALLRNYAAERAKQVGELRTIVRQSGERAVEEGSFAGAFHQGWINLKSAIGQGDAAILAECERADEITLSAYQDVMSKTTNEPLLDILRKQHGAIKAAYERIKGLRSALQISPTSST